MDIADNIIFVNTLMMVEVEHTHFVDTERHLSMIVKNK